MSSIYWNVNRQGFAKQHLFLTKPVAGMMTSVATGAAPAVFPDPLIPVDDSIFM